MSAPNTFMPIPNHWESTHFTGITAAGQKFVYCPEGNIVSWSEGDHDNKWCHWCKEYFENKDIGGIHLTGVNKVKVIDYDATPEVTRFEVIDHRQCVSCRGRKTANYLQKDGSYKEQPCEICDGSGINGGRVFVASSNPERSIISVDLSYQDEGRTLKVFINDKEQQ